MCLMLLCGITQYYGQSTYSKAIKKVNTTYIRLNEDVDSERDVVKYAHHSILVAQRNNKWIVVTTLTGRIKYKVKMKIYPYQIGDVTIDEQGNLFVLDNIKRIVLFLHKDGTIGRKISILAGDEIVVANNIIYLYRKLYFHNDNTAKAIMEYDLNGKLINSFGNVPIKAIKGNLHPAAGSMCVSKNTVLVCHCTDYLVEIYNKAGVLMKSYTKKPSFYSDFKTFTNIKDPNEIKLWRKYTTQLCCMPYDGSGAISYYANGEMTESWLIIQTESQYKECSIPSFLRPLFMYKNKMYAINRKNESSKSIKLESYEIIKTY